MLQGLDREMASPVVGDGTALIFGHCVLEGLDGEVALAVVGDGAVLIFSHCVPQGLDEETISAAVSSGTDTAEEPEPEDVLTMEELQLALHSMQINR